MCAYLIVYCCCSKWKRDYEGKPRHYVEKQKKCSSQDFFFTYCQLSPIRWCQHAWDPGLDRGFVLSSLGVRKVTETILVPKHPRLCEREMLLSKLFLHIRGKIIITTHFLYCVLFQAICMQLNFKLLTLLLFFATVQVSDQGKGSLHELPQKHSNGCRAEIVV